MSVRGWIRSYLGTDPIGYHSAALKRIEDRMTTFITLLNGLASQQAEASAAQQASFLNLHNAMARLDEQVAALTTAVANGDVSPEVQAATEQISQALTDMKTAANTADDGFEPVVDPAEPTVPPVVDPGTSDGPVGTGDEPATPEVPVEPGDDVPVENSRRGR